jgi:hypothetical protein
MASKWSVLKVIRIELRHFIALVLGIREWWEWPGHGFTILT